MVTVPDRGTTEMWKVVVNRCLAVFTIGMTLYLGLRRRRAEARRAAAEEQAREHLADLARMARLTAAGQLAAGLAHELNQPLAAVSLQAEVAAKLAEAGTPPDDIVPTLREIADQSHRAAEIVRGLRRMLRRDAPPPCPIDLREVVRVVAPLLDGPARRAGVDVRLELGPVPPVSGDRVQLEQVVFNLLQNAVEAVAEVSGGGEVLVITAGGGHAAVTVRDTGPGLPPGDPERVFERFFSTKPNGMGMGLAISRWIVESHGGKLVAGGNPGGGAEFTVTLPACEDDEP
jgi:signal transduction histidine kinase